jgi:hypothetical protein
VFVSRAFAVDEIAHPRPGINDRIIASVARGQSVVLTEAEVRAANSSSGLDLVTLYGTHHPAILNAAEISEVYSLLGALFLAHHAGYRIHWMIAEAVDESERRFLADTHVWRIIENFEVGRGLAMVTPEDALRVKGSFINPLFHYQEPVLRLRSADQELLLAARDGLTDEELSNELGMSLPAVKKRWLSLFERTIDSRPDLFPGVQQGTNGPGRGRQKRHHELAYMRTHPQELRPFAYEIPPKPCSLPALALRFVARDNVT